MLGMPQGGTGMVPLDGEVQHVVSLLESTSMPQRKEGIDALRGMLRASGGQLPGGKPGDALLGALAARLREPNWAITQQVLQVILEAIPGSASDVFHSGGDSLLPAIVHALGDFKVVIRKAASQVLELLLKHVPAGGNQLLECILKHALSATDSRLRLEGAHAISSLLAKIPEQDVPVKALVVGLVENLGSGPETQLQATIQALSALRSKCSEQFSHTVRRLPNSTISLYQTHAEQIVKGSHEGNFRGARSTRAAPAHTASNNFAADPSNLHPETNSNTASASRFGQQPAPPSSSLHSGQGSLSHAVLQFSEPSERRHLRPGGSGHSGELAYGVVPVEIVQAVSGTADWRIRAQAVQDLQQTLSECTDWTAVTPHLSGLIDLLLRLLSDSNFKIELTALQIVADVVGKAGADLRPYHTRMIPPLVDKLGDSKIVVRQSDQKVLMQLMQIASPRAVTALLLPALQHRNWRVRDETVHILVQAWQTYDADQFDVNAMVSSFGKCLADVKPKVRSGAMDALVSMHISLGDRLYTMLQSISDDAMAVLRERCRQHFTEGDTAGSQAPTAGLGSGMGKLEDEGVLWRMDSAASSRGPGNQKIPWNLPALRSGTPGSSAAAGMYTVDGQAGYSGLEDNGFNPPPRSALEGSGSSPDSLVPSPLVVSADGTTDANFQPRRRGSSITARRSHQHSPGLDSVKSSATAPPNFAAGGQDAVESFALPSSAYAKSEDFSPANGSFNTTPVRGNGHQQNEQPLDSGSHFHESPSSAVGGDLSSQYSYDPQHRIHALDNSPSLDGNLNNVLYTGDGPLYSSSQQHVTTDDGNQSVRRRVNQQFSLSNQNTDQQHQQSEGDDKVALWLPNSLRSPSRATQGIQQDQQVPSLIADQSDGPANANPGFSGAQADMSQAFVNGLTKSEPTPERRSRPQSGRRAMLGHAVGDAAATPGPAPSPSPAKAMHAVSRIQQEAASEDTRVWSASAAVPRPTRRAELNSDDQIRAGTADNAARQPAKTSPSRRKLTSSMPSRPRQNGSGTGSVGNEAWGSSSVASKRGDKSIFDLNAKPIDYIETDDLKSLPDPAGAINRCLPNLESSEWNVAIEAMNVVRSAAVHHPQVLQPHVHTICRRLIVLADSLRSSVSKAALIAVADVIKGMRSQLDPEADAVILALVKKCGETSSFIADEAKKALALSVTELSEGRVVLALQRASTHKNSNVRSKVAYGLEKMLEAKAGRISVSIVDKVVKMAAVFVGEAAAETRASGRRCIASLYGGLGESLHVAIRRLPDNEAKAASAAVDKVTSSSLSGSNHGTLVFSGASDAPMVQSGMRGLAGPRRSRLSKEGSVGRMSTATSSSGVGGSNSPAGMTPTAARSMSDSSAVPSRTSSSSSARNPLKASRAHRPVLLQSSRPSLTPDQEQQIEKVPSLLSQLSSSDFRKRTEAIDGLVDVVSCVKTGMGDKLAPVVEGLMSRLTDNNAKVSVSALRASRTVIMECGQSLGPLSAIIIPAAASAMAATQANVRSLASEVLDASLSSIDPASLVQPWCSAIEYGNQRSRGAMLQRLSPLVDSVAGVKPNLLMKHAVPTCARLTSESKADVRNANIQVAKSLYEALGDQMFTAAARLPSSAQDKLRSACFS